MAENMGKFGSDGRQNGSNRANPAPQCTTSLAVGVGSNDVMAAAPPFSGTAVDPFRVQSEDVYHERNCSHGAVDRQDCCESEFC
jgi:hypothetical protein